MRKYLSSLVAILCVGLALDSSSVGAQSREPGNSPAGSGAAQAMALGPQQAALGEWLGRWDVQIVLSDGSKAAQHSTGNTECAWVVTGRWLGCRLLAKMLGFPYEQFTIFGYDSYAKNVVEVAVGSVDNSMLQARGPTPGPNQAVTALFGELDEYTTGVLHSPYKVLLRRVSPDRRITTIMGLDVNGNEVKKVEFTFSRSRAP